MPEDASNDAPREMTVVAEGREADRETEFGLQVA